MCLIIFVTASALINTPAALSFKKIDPSLLITSCSRKLNQVRSLYIQDFEALGKQGPGRWPRSPCPRAGLGSRCQITDATRAAQWATIWLLPTMTVRLAACRPLCFLGWAVYIIHVYTWVWAPFCHGPWAGAHAALPPGPALHLTASHDGHLFKHVTVLLLGGRC